MEATATKDLSVSGEELAVLTDLLDVARTKLLVEIRRTDHRTFREELRQRLTIIEGLLTRFRPT